MTLSKPDDFEAIPGHGIRVKIDEKNILYWKPKTDGR